MNDPTIEPDIESANHELTALRSRASAADATAADSLALGHWLLRHAQREKAFRGEALAAFARAYQLDASCEPGLLQTIAQTAFTLRDWTLVEAAADRLLAKNPADADVLVWRASALQQRDDFAGAERVRREGGRVIYGHDGPLWELFERFLPADFPLETSMETHPDFHCGLMSVPLRLGASVFSMRPVGVPRI